MTSDAVGQPHARDLAERRVRLLRRRSCRRATHTPRFCGHLWRAGLPVRILSRSRPRRTSWIDRGHSMFLLCLQSNQSLASGPPKHGGGPAPAPPVLIANRRIISAWHGRSVSNIRATPAEAGDVGTPAGEGHPPSRRPLPWTPADPATPGRALMLVPDRPQGTFLQDHPREIVDRHCTRRAHGDRWRDGEPSILQGPKKSRPLPGSAGSRSASRGREEKDVNRAMDRVPASCPKSSRRAVMSGDRLEEHPRSGGVSHDHRKRSPPSIVLLAAVRMSRRLGASPFFRASTIRMRSRLQTARRTGGRPHPPAPRRPLEPSRHVRRSLAGAVLTESPGSIAIALSARTITAPTFGRGGQNLFLRRSSADRGWGPATTSPSPEQDPDDGSHPYPAPNSAALPFPTISIRSSSARTPPPMKTVKPRSSPWS